MTMSRYLHMCALRAIMKLVGRSAVAAVLCSTMMTVVIAAPPDPNKTFMQNYLAPAYFMPVAPLAGDKLGGDLFATYDQAYMPVRSWAELLIIGEFPRARFFSITLYDDHGAIIGAFRDDELDPLRSTDINPYRPGGAAGTEDILYAVRVQLGNSLADAPVAGCQINDMDISSNVLDARFRHTAGTRYSPDLSRGYIDIYFAAVRSRAERAPCRSGGRRAGSHRGAYAGGNERDGSLRGIRLPSGQ